MLSLTVFDSLTIGYYMQSNKIISDVIGLHWSQHFTIKFFFTQLQIASGVSSDSYGLGKNPHSKVSNAFVILLIRLM